MNEETKLSLIYFFKMGVSLPLACFCAVEWQEYTTELLGANSIPGFLTGWLVLLSTFISTWIILTGLVGPKDNDTTKQVDKR